MPVGDELRINIRTTLDIGRAQHAHTFLALLERRGADWIPTRFGPYEPLKHSFFTEGASGFEQCWLGDPQGDSGAGDVIFKIARKRGGWGWVEWRRQWNATFNRLSLYLAGQTLQEVGVGRILALAEDLFETFAGAYGSITMDGEFRSQHFTAETGLNPQGIALQEHIPGVYFANFFGQAIVDFLGEDALERCPAVVNRRLIGSGWLITTADSPTQWNEPRTRNLKRDVRVALGERHFFDIAYPERTTTAPAYDFSEVRIGERPTAAKKLSVAEEYFDSDAAARGFIEESHVWCERLRHRLPPATLDFSTASLRVLDNHLSAIRSDHVKTEARALVLEVAAYYGEVLRHVRNATWNLDAKDTRMPCLQLPDGDVEYPLVRAIKLVEDGDHLSDWFDFIERGGPGLLA